MARGRNRWWLVAVAAGLPALVLIWLVTAVVRAATSDDPLGRGPREVPCAEALEFGGARLPAGAYDTRCTVEVWLDTRYAAEFRMPRAELAGWLGRSYPGAPRRTGFCPGDTTDLCVSVGFAEGGGERMPGEAYPGFGAHTANVLVDYEGPATALVRFSAFTV